MDARLSSRTPYTAPRDEKPAPDLAQWLNVSGDLDDFIYYGEEPRTSEK